MLHAFKFSSAFSDIYWNQLALSCSSNMWNCQILILLRMHSVPSRSIFISLFMSWSSLISRRLPKRFILYFILGVYLQKDVWQELLTRHETAVSQFLSGHYEQVSFWDCGYWVASLLLKVLFSPFYQVGFS